MGAPQHRLQRNREVDGRRGSARKRGYTTQWDRAAKAHLRDHPLCIGCEAIGLTVEARTVDHVEPHRGDMVKFWNRDMWQGCCRWHHDTVKQHLEHLLSKGEATLGDMWLTSDFAKKITISMKYHCAAPGGQNL